MEIAKIADELQSRSMAARDWVFEVIRTAIIRGVLQGGMPLRQDEISAALNVSHIPVREAFRQLEAQGLVRIYPNRGAVVTKLTIHELTNIMDTRIMLEIGVLRSSIPLLRNSDFDKAKKALKVFEEEDNIAKFDEDNLNFHFALYYPCDNQVALKMIDQLHANVDRYLHPFYEANTDSEIKSIAEHNSLIEACRNRDTELASAILRTHLEKTRIALLQSPLL